MGRIVCACVGGDVGRPTLRVPYMHDVITLPTRRRDADPGRRTYSVEEAAELLGISRSHAYNCVKSGDLPSLRLRRRIVVPAQAIAALLAGE